MAEESLINRRLAAILAADIAGYSRLMHANEPATVRDLKAHQSVILPLIGRHGGRVIDTAGDGILAEFPSVIGATECAVELQTVMAERNERVPESRRMLFRIGINLGDVIHDESRIYGDGINIAARLEALAEPGGVLVSSTVYDHVRGQLPLTFADGITEDLTTDLSRLAGGFVISRNTAFTLKGKAVDARQIGRELRVRYVLEGSVRRMGRTVRVNAQLIDAGTGAHLWAEQMDVDQGTLTTSQDNFGIASRLAKTLSVELVNVEGRRAPRANPDAVDLTMRGWSILNAAPQQAEAKKSVTLFEDALRIDPDNSQASVGLAHALTLIHRNRWDPEPARILARADEAVTRAIALSPNYAHAHYVKAEVLALSGRFDAALATYDRAIAHDPNHAAAYVARGRSLIAIGRAAEAVAPG